MFLDRVIHFGETLGDQVKGRSSKKLTSLIEVQNLVHVQEHVLNGKMLAIAVRGRVHTPRDPAWENMWAIRQGFVLRKKLNILIEVP